MLNFLYKSKNNNLKYIKIIRLLFQLNYIKINTRIWGSNICLNKYLKYIFDYIYLYILLDVILFIIIINYFNMKNGLKKFNIFRKFLTFFIK